MTRTIKDIEKEIVEDFELFDEWSDKYAYIIDLGKKLPVLDERYKRDEFKVKGCQASVWLNCRMEDGRVYFDADSDSQFVKGEISLLIKVLSGQPPEEIVSASLGFIDKIGLRQNIVLNRAVGLESMIKTMKSFAKGFVGNEVKE